MGRMEWWGDSGETGGFCVEKREEEEEKEDGVGRR